MLRHLLFTLAVTGFAVSLAAAQTSSPSAQPNAGSPTAGSNNMLQGRITGVTGNRMTFQPFNTTTNQFGNPQTFDIGNQVQFFQTQGTQRSPLTGGLTADPFRNIGPNGQWASFRLNNNSLAEIQLMNTPANLTNLPPIPGPNANPNPYTRPNVPGAPNGNANPRQPQGTNPYTKPNVPGVPNPGTTPGANPNVNPNQPANPAPNVNPNQPAVPNSGTTPLPPATPNQTRGGQ